MSYRLNGAPALEDQAGIWKLLKPEEIGVQLTEGFMMDPEVYPESFSRPASARWYSITRIVYFHVGESGDAT